VLPFPQEWHGKKGSRDNSALAFIDLLEYFWIYIYIYTHFVSKFESGPNLDGFSASLQFYLKTTIFSQ
jgi:hypothetical protein